MVFNVDDSIAFIQLVYNYWFTVFAGGKIERTKKIIDETEKILTETPDE